MQPRLFVFASVFPTIGPGFRGGASEASFFTCRVVT
jgi:hypothetical protein